MKKNLLVLFLVLLAFVQAISMPHPVVPRHERKINDTLPITPGPYVYVENYRVPDAPDDSIINLALQAAGKGNAVLLEPFRIYNITNQIVMDSAQFILGNNATFRRENALVTSLASDAFPGTTSFALTDVPAGFKVGDRLQLYTDQTAKKSINSPRTITAINDNIISFTPALTSSNDGTITTWPTGTSVRKVYTLIATNYNIDVVEAPFSVYDLQIDGNKAGNDQNFYWFANTSILVRGFGSNIINCSFQDIPNENIVGQGIIVKNCHAKRLWGSFVHLSGQANAFDRLQQKNTFISDNFVDSVCLVTNDISGHSEGAVTSSYNGGFATISNNRFFNGKESVFGQISWVELPSTEGIGELLLVGNLFKGFRKIIDSIRQIPSSSLSYPRSITISSNTFDSCGINDWGYSATYVSHYQMSFINNHLTGGTTFTNVPSSIGMLVTNGAQIGIGTGAPATTLDVNGRITSRSRLLVAGAVDDNSTALQVAGQAKILKRLTLNSVNTGFMDGQAFTGEASVNDVGIRNDMGNILFASKTAAVKMVIDTLGRVGIGGTPTSALLVNGSIARKVRSTSVSTTLNNDYYLNVTNTTNIVITLPSALGISGRTYSVKKTTNNTSSVTLTPNGAETIDGDSNKVLNVYNDSITFYSDGANWFIQK